MVGTALMTVVVSGATLITMPSPRIDDRGEKPQYDRRVTGKRQQAEAERGDRWTNRRAASGRRSGRAPARPARQAAHDDRERQEGGAGERGRKTVHLDQRKRQKEECAAERGIKEQGQQIDGAEGARAKQSERQHRARLCASSQMKTGMSSKPAASDNETVGSLQPATGAEMRP